MTTRTHIAKQDEAEIERAVQLLSADPGSPADNQLWLNHTEKLLKVQISGETITIGGGGGGGGSLEWVESVDSPEPDIENDIRIYKYTAALTQKLYTLVKVPSSYQAGNQIKLLLPFYSNDTSGTVLMQTVATLIRSGTDQVSSTTNQRTSTNTAVTLGAGTQNEPQAVEFDLTDSSGEVNSVAVSAGDLIKVQLKRGTDTATDYAKVPVHAAEVTFNG